MVHRIPMRKLRVPGRSAMERAHILHITALIFLGVPARSAEHPCARDLAVPTRGRTASPRIDEGSLNKFLVDLGRFALDEVQKADQPSSVQVELREALQKKLHVLAARSGRPVHEIQGRLLEAKRDWLFAGSARELPVRLREEREQLTGRFEKHRLFDDYRDSVLAVAFNPDGEWIVTGDAAQTVQVHELKPPGRTPFVDRHRGEVHSVVFSPDGKRRLSSSADKTVMMWGDSRGMTVWQSKSDRVTSLAYRPDGAVIAAGTDKGDVLIWPVRDDGGGGWSRLGAPQVLRSGKVGIERVVFSWDGKLAAAADDSVYLWDDLEHDPQTLSAGDELTILSIALSPDGKTLAAGLWNGSIALWDLNGKDGPETFRCFDARGVLSLAFSPDGKTLAAGGSGVKLWDVANRREIRHLKDENFTVRSVAFSPDGTLLAAASERDFGGEGHVTVWREVNFDLEEDR